MNRRQVLLASLGLTPLAAATATAQSLGALPETKDCSRQDCRIASDGGGSMTLLGWSPIYDRNGNRTDGGDPNTYTSYSRCLTCGKQFVTKTTRGRTETHVVLPVEGK